MGTQSGGVGVWDRWAGTPGGWGVMSDLPEGARGRAVTLALTALALALLWLGCIAPLRAWQADQAEQIDLRARMLARMQSLAERLPQMKAQAAARPADAPASAVLLQGRTDAVAAAELQQVVQQLVLDAGGRLSSAEILSAEPVGPYRRIALRISLQAPYAAGVTLLNSIATARPGMLIDDLKLQAPAMRNIAMPMEISFTVFAYRQGGGT